MNTQLSGGRKENGRPLRICGCDVIGEVDQMLGLTSLAHSKAMQYAESHACQPKTARRALVVQARSWFGFRQDEVGAVGPKAMRDFLNSIV